MRAFIDVYAEWLERAAAALARFGRELGVDRLRAGPRRGHEQAGEHAHDQEPVAIR